MQTTIQKDGAILRDEAYNALEAEIKQHLIKNLEMWKMTLKQVAEVCFLLGHAKTAQGLNFLVENLRKNFDVFEEMEDAKESEEDTVVDQIVQRYVSDLIKTDPLKAAEVGSRASAEGVTLATLLEEFPDLQKYI